MWFKWWSIYLASTKPWFQTSLLPPKENSYKYKLYLILLSLVTYGLVALGN
jgi:hypothetical protein